MTAPGEVAPQPPPASDGRVLSLSDGVFAFALTLMVVTLDVPRPENVPASRLASTVRDQWPGFLSYGLSFWIILIFWFVHRRLFRLVIADDAVSGWLNGLFLFFIAFLPYPTDMMGNYPDSPFAVNFYNLWTIGTSLAFAATFMYVRRHPRLTGGALPHIPLASELLQEAMIAGPFVLSIAATTISVDLARDCWYLIPVGHFIAHRSMGRSGFS